MSFEFFKDGMDMPDLRRQIERELEQLVGDATDVEVNYRMKIGPRAFSTYGGVQTWRAYVEGDLAPKENVDQTKQEEGAPE
jgi:hypothetical protein